MNIKGKEKTKNQVPPLGIGKSIRSDVEAVGSGGVQNFKLWMNVITVAIGFLFGGCHLVFGAYPLGLALVSVLEGGVWLALLGVALGSLTLGRSGIIYGMIAILAVFLRIVISGGEKANVRQGGGNGAEGGNGLFSEKILLRVCSAVISGFVAALYEVLLSGLSLESILFGVSMILLPGIITLALSGIYLQKIGPYELIFGSGRIFSGSEAKGERAKLILYRASVLIFITLVSVSLGKYKIFGVDIGFIFAGAITVFTAKRFGSLYGAVVGFFASFGISGLYSPAFALLGAASGAIFTFGSLYALIAGGAFLSLWGAYAGGVSGFLSVFPEYLISACLMFPVIRYLEREDCPEVRESVRRRATDMVGTMALAYRNRQSLVTEELECALGSLLPKIKGFSRDNGLCEDYTVFAKLLSDAGARANADRDMNEELTDRIEKIFFESGFSDGVVRAFGEKRPHFILAGEDRDGVLITAPALREKISQAAGVKLSEPEYFRRDDMVLMECMAAKRYKLRSANAKLAGASGEVSGDTVKVFEGADFFAYGLISDGMGSGEVAKETSEFVSAFLSSVLGCTESYSTVMHALNSIIRRGSEECSVSVDLFSFDLVRGEATFIKSGAAPSYIKRGESLFRIKSQTMPLGLLKQVDAEKIVAEVAEGDVIIMLSDGILPGGDETSWLPELLKRPIEGELGDFAREIIEAAVENGGGADDMSVLVMKVVAL